MKERRNVLFVIPPYLKNQLEAKNTKIRSYKAFPYGVLSIASYLKNNSSRKVNIQVFDCNDVENDHFITVLKKVITDINPNLVGLSMMFDTSLTYLKDISRIIKEFNKSTVVVLGGAAACSSYEIILGEQENIDGICYLEGEIPTTKLINSENMYDFLDYDDSWVTKKSLKEGKEPQSNFIEDLDQVINIDYSFVEIKQYHMKESFSPFIYRDGVNNKKQFFLVTSRGCPYNCIFCSTGALHGKKIRYASIESIISHVKHLVSVYGMNILTIYDDQLLANQDRAKEIFRKLAQFNLRVECPNGLSVAFIDDEMATLMKKAGMDTISLAIESD